MVHIDSNTFTKESHAPVVLLYHRINNIKIDNQYLSVSVKNFEEHLRMLTAKRKVVSLRDLLRAAAKGHFVEDAVAITFDDGYADNLHNALPVLEKYRCPATIFVSSGMVDSQKGFWGDAFEDTLLGDHSLPDTLTLPGGHVFSLCTSKERLHTHDAIRKQLKEQFTHKEIWETIAFIRNALNLPRDWTVKHPALTLEQLRLLSASPLIEIGAHCVTHTWLAALPAPQQRWEIQTSVSELSEWIGKPVRFFSYPYGSPNSYTEETLGILRELGLTGIANRQGELAPPIDMLQIPRRLIRDWDADHFTRWLTASGARRSSMETETLAGRETRLVNELSSFKKPSPARTITFVNSTASKGGAANSTRLMGVALSKKGYKISTLVHGAVDRDMVRSFPVARTERIAEKARAEGLLDYDLQGSHTLVNHPDICSADILHLQNLHGGFFNPFSISLLSRLKPTVWTLRDMWALTGHCAHALDCPKWETGCGECPDLAVYPGIAKDSTAQLWADKQCIYEHSRLWITCPSDWLTQKVRRSILSSHPVRTIMNAVDTSIYMPRNKQESRRRFGLPENALVIGMAADGGLNNAWKGGQCALETLHVLGNMFPELYFLSIGGRPVEGIANLRCVPYIDSPEGMAAFYSSLDFTLFTSRADTCPLALIESLCCGTPVAGFAVGGAPEIVRDGVDGLMTPQGETEALLRASVLLLRQPELLHKMGAHAAKDATHRFSLDRLASDYEALYDEILATPGTPPQPIPQSKLPALVKTPEYLCAERDVETQLALAAMTPEVKEPYKWLANMPTSVSAESAWRVSPTSRIFGLELGTSLCRYYLEKFLYSCRECIAGKVLEVGDPGYTKRFGGNNVCESSVLNAVPGNAVTIVGDLSSGTNIPKDAFDCIILTQTLQFIYDFKAALSHAYQALAPGGTLLLSVPVISPISRYDMIRWGEYWRFTHKALEKLFGEVCPDAVVDLYAWGNAASAKGYLDGLPAEAFPPKILDVNDPDYQMLLTAKIERPVSNTHGSDGVKSLSAASASEAINKLDSLLSTKPPHEAAQINEAFKSCDYLEKRLLSRAFPALWSIETTNVCSMKCSHCPRTFAMSRPQGHMSRELLYKALDQVRAYAQFIYGKVGLMKFIHFGEPLLYKYLAESLDASHERGLTSCISSTASVLTPRFIDIILQHHLKGLWLIFEGMDDETFQKIRGPHASFTKGLEALFRLLKLKQQRHLQYPSISVDMIRHPDNRHQWTEFKDFFSKIKGLNTSLAHFSCYNNKYPQLLNLKERMSDDPDVCSNDTHIRTLNSYTCYYPWHSMVVLWDGRVVPCCRDMNGDYILGDLNKESLLDIWNGEKMQSLRREMLSGRKTNPLCKSCCEANLECGTPAMMSQEVIMNYHNTVDSYATIVNSIR